MPAAIPSETLGIAPATAAVWAGVTGSPRAGYAAELARRTPPPPAHP
ncbi:hypothetical protein OG948_33840 [Embleya sp. NBC_00888]|nr:hypothetical protein OG948_33840 [Embleya sp. NBC_00888]